MTVDNHDALLKEAIERYAHLHGEARKSGQAEPSVATLATVDRDGRPTLRSMFISHFDDGGFVFFTSNGSRKGVHLAERPVAAICFYWEVLNEQVAPNEDRHVILDPAAEADSHDRLGHARPQRQDVDGALAAFRRALDGDPGQFDEAVALFEDIARRKPDDAGSRNDMAYSLDRTGRPGEALAAARKALVLDPTHLRSLLIAANCLMKLRQRDDALPYPERGDGPA